MSRQTFTGRAVLLVLAVALPLAGLPATNGFDLSPSLVPRREILSGGPPRDGIVSIDAPRFVAVSRASYMDADDRVLGLIFRDVARAYPVKILNWHEIVNDTVAGRGVVVTYCPLCGSGMAFEAGTHQFGVSGLLYQSDLLLYDRGSDSLWSQILGKAVTGKLMGEELVPIPVRHTQWADWAARHPASLVLAPPGRGDYEAYPYGNYERSRDVYFPLEHRSRRYHPKEWVLGVELEGAYRAYPFSELAKVGSPLVDAVGERRIRVHFDARTQAAWAETWAEDRTVELPATRLFWFAWYGFHPDTSVFTANAR